MIHIAVALVAFSLTCAALALASVVDSAALGVDTSFVVGSCGALAASTVLLWYVWRERL